MKTYLIDQPRASTYLSMIMLLFTMISRLISIAI